MRKGSRKESYGMQAQRGLGGRDADNNKSQDGEITKAVKNKHGMKIGDDMRESSPPPKMPDMLNKCGQSQSHQFEHEEEVQGQDVIEGVDPEYVIKYASEASLINPVILSEDTWEEAWDTAKQYCKDQEPSAIKIDEKHKMIYGMLVDISKAQWAHYELGLFVEDLDRKGLFIHRFTGDAELTQPFWSRLQKELEDKELVDQGECDETEDDSNCSLSTCSNLSTEDMSDMSITFSQNISYSSSDDEDYVENKILDERDIELRKVHLKSHVRIKDKLKIMLLMCGDLCGDDAAANAQLILPHAQDFVEEGFKICEALDYMFVSVWAVMKFASEVMKRAQVNNQAEPVQIEVQNAYQEAVIEQLRKFSGAKRDQDANNPGTKQDPDIISESDDLAELIVENLSGLYPNYMQKRVELKDISSKCTTKLRRKLEKLTLLTNRQ